MTGAYAEMELSDTSPTEGTSHDLSTSSSFARPAAEPEVVISGPIRAEPPRWVTKPREEQSLMGRSPLSATIGQPGPEEDEDDGIPGVVYKTTTIGGQGR